MRVLKEDIILSFLDLGAQYSNDLNPLADYRYNDLDHFLNHAEELIPTTSWKPFKNGCERILRFAQEEIDEEY